MTLDPVGVVRALSEHEVRFAVVGGFALAAHGVVRATEDLDIVVDRGLDNATRLARGLTALDATWHEPLEPEVLVRRIDARIETRLGTVHILREVSGVPTYGELDREQVEIDGVRFEVASVAAIRDMKRAAGRDKDLVDLAELDRVQGSGDPEE